MLPYIGKRTGTSPESTIEARSLPDDSTVAASSPGEPGPALEPEKEITTVDDVAWPFFDVFNAKKPLHITALPPTIGKGFGIRKNGWNDLPREAIVMPIAAEGDEVPIGVMVFGVNTRRPYDEGTFALQFLLFCRPERMIGRIPDVDRLATYVLKLYIDSNPWPGSRTEESRVSRAGLWWFYSCCNLFSAYPDN